MADNSTTRQIIINTITGWGAILVRALIALVMVPFLLGQLGKEGYGLIALLGVLLGLTSVADLGLRQALGRELSELVARKDRQGFSELCSTALLLYLCIAAILSTIMLFCAPWFASIFKVPHYLYADAVLMIRIYGMGSITLSFITPVFSSSLISNHRFDLVNMAQIAGGIISSIAMFIFLPFIDNALYGWCTIMLIFQIFLFLFTYYLFRRECINVHIRLSYINLLRLGGLFRLGGYMYIIQLTQTLSEKFDPLVISSFFGPAGVALYQPGGKVSTILRPLVLTFADQMYPLATKHHIDSQRHAMQRILLLGTKYTMLLGSLFCAGLLVFAEPFCKIWLSSNLGEDYFVAAQIMMGWAIIDFLTYASGTQWSILLGMKRLRFLIWVELPAAILNLVVSIYIVGFTSLGIPGVLVSTIIIGLVRRPVVAWYTAKVCGLSMKTYIFTSYLRPFICLMITLCGAVIIRHYIDSGLIVGLVLCSSLVILLWGGACWTVGLVPEERKIAGKEFRKRIRERMQ